MSVHWGGRGPGHRSRWSATATRFDIYIDSVAGSDANSGLTEDAPKQTWAAAAALVPAGGSKRIGIKRGSVIQEECILTANYMTVAAYGPVSDPLPLIDGGESLSAGGWAATGGQAGVYERAVATTGSLPGSGGEFRNAWEGGKVYVKATSLANCQATAGTCFFSSYTAGTATLYIHPYGDTDPTTDGKARAWSKRHDVLTLSGIGCQALNIWTRRQRRNDGSLVMGSAARMYGCLVEDGHKHCALMSQGGVADRCTFQNAYNGTGGVENHLVFFSGGTPVLAGITVTNCTFIQDVAVVPVFAASVISHSANGTDAFSTYTASGNRHRRSSGHSMGNVSAATVTRDLFLDCPTTYTQLEAVSITFDDCQIVVIATGGLGSVRLLPVMSSGGVATVNRLKLSSNKYCAHLVSTAMTLNLNDSLFYEGDTTTAFPLGMVRTSSAGAIVSANRCTFQKTFVSDYFLSLVTGNVYTGNNNHFVGASPRWTLDNTTTNITTLAGWRTASGQDAASDQVGDASSAATYDWAGWIT